MNADLAVRTLKRVRNPAWRDPTSQFMPLSHDMASLQAEQSELHLAVWDRQLAPWDGRCQRKTVPDKDPRDRAVHHAEVPSKHARQL